MFKSTDFIGNMPELDFNLADNEDYWYIDINGIHVYRATREELKLLRISLHNLLLDLNLELREW